MQMGLVGLCRMGSYRVRRLLRDGQECVVYDSHPDAVRALASDGAIACDTLDDMVSALQAPRAIWLMVPAAVVDQVLERLVPLLDAEDIVIDGGNSSYHDDIRRAGRLRDAGLHYMDVGTSGGVYGLDRGYCLMIGGDDASFQRMEPVFAALAPGKGS